MRWWSDLSVGSERDLVLWTVLKGIELKGTLLSFSFGPDERGGVVRGGVERGGVERVLIP